VTLEWNTKDSENSGTIQELKIFNEKDYTKTQWHQKWNPEDSVIKGLREK
jgi:hypothetical protein